jgi:hypothetical protein
MENKADFSNGFCLLFFLSPDEISKQKKNYKKSKVLIVNKITCCFTRFSSKFTTNICKEKGFVNEEVLVSGLAIAAHTDYERGLEN